MFIDKDAKLAFKIGEVIPVAGALLCISQPQAFGYRLRAPIPLDSSRKIASFSFSEFLVCRHRARSTVFLYKCQKLTLNIGEVVPVTPWFCRVGELQAQSFGYGWIAPTSPYGIFKIT